MERRLVERAMHGDEAAFDDLVARVGDHLHSIARRILRDPYLAEDAAVWLDPDLPAEQAETLVRSVALEPDAFAWHPVHPAVANVQRQGSAVVEPIDFP